MATEPSTPLNRSRKASTVALAVCVALFAIGQFHRASGSIFTPVLMETMRLTASSAGLLVSSMFIASVVCQVPMGIWLDRTGPRRVLVVCTLLVALGTALFALVPEHVWLVVSRVLIGIGLASMGAATQVILARAVPSRQFGYANGLLISLGGIGGLLGTYPLALLMSHFSWTFVFLLVAALTVVLAAGVFFLIEPQLPQRSIAVDATPTDPERGYRWLLAQPEFLKILVLGVVCYAPITNVTGLWGGPYLQDSLGLSATSAGAVLSGVFASTIVAGYVFGRLDRQIQRRKLLIMVAAGVSITCLALLASVPKLGVTTSIALLLAMVFSQQFYIPLGAHLLRVVPQSLLGRAASAFSLVAVASIPATQMGFGWILDTTAAWGWSEPDRYRAGFAVLGCVILLCTAVYSTTTMADDST